MAAIPYGMSSRRPDVADALLTEAAEDQPVENHVTLKVANPAVVGGQADQVGEHARFDHAARPPRGLRPCAGNGLEQHPPGRLPGGSECGTRPVAQALGVFKRLQLIEQ